MNELFYLVSSFWLGALHAATPGHGKTIAAAYIVGARGRPVDALVLGIFVTLSHTSGIVLVAVFATLGSARPLPRRVEAYGPGGASATEAPGHRAKASIAPPPSARRVEPGPVVGNGEAWLDHLGIPPNALSRAIEAVPTKGPDNLEDD